MESEYESVKNVVRICCHVVAIYSKEFQPGEYSFTEAYTLGAIGRHPGVSAVQIADFVDMNKGYLSRIIKKLVSNGLVLRKRYPGRNGSMSEEFLTKLYEPFSQEHRAEAGNVAGTGLGLTIVKRIVDLMNGTITVESQVNKGTKFMIDLPVSRIEEDGGESASSSQVIALNGKNILLCEDNDMNAEIAALLLKEQGVEVTRAENGQAGVDLFAASPEGFFYSVLMDLRMDGNTPLT